MQLDVDSLYREGCRALSGELHDVAHTLAYRLGLVPEPEIPWSQVFQHQVTLAAPVLLAHLAPSLDHEDLGRIVLSHMLAVIEAFGSDRLHDQQVADPGGELARLMASLRLLRNDVVQRVDPDAPAEFEGADYDVRDAFEAEREILTTRRAVSLTQYARLSLQKQAPGFPATMALTRLGAIGAERRARVRAALEGVWLGLQFADDVIDWEDDFERGGAWALSVAGGLGAEVSAEALLGPCRDRLFESMALAQMLSLSQASFESARDAAKSVGADELARWAAQQHERVAELEEGERRAPGYALRKHRLRHFAREVQR